MTELLSARPELLFGEGSAVLTSEQDAIRVSGRTQRYSSLAADVWPLLTVGKAYRFTFSVRSDGAPFRMAPYMKIIYQMNGNEYIHYSSGLPAEIGPDWTDLTIKTYFDPQFTVSRVIVCTIQQSTEGLPDFSVRSLTYEEEEAPAQEREVTRLSPQPLTIGAIRWDAWFDVNETRSNVSRQTAATLGPQHFHDRLPFFTKVIDENTVAYPQETQDDFDREVQYAKKAGFAYFAYCWYHGAMDYARVLHRTSRYSDQVQMCAIIHVSGLSDDDLRELADDMVQSYYFKLDGRPLVYVFNCGTSNPEERRKLIALAAERGLPRPYFVAMTAVDPWSQAELCCGDYDAVGAYGSSSTGPDQAYADFAARNEARYNGCYQLNPRYPLIPNIACGLDFRPRIEHPVSWMKGSYYVNVPTPEELYTHAYNTLKALHDHPIPGGPNSVLVYAWNEHDEGGWCCPTLAVNENGLPTGKAPNETHLLALKKAFDQFLK